MRNCDYPADGNFSLFTLLSSLKITSESVTIDGKPLELQEKGGALLTEVYKRYIGDYPKYYKMDVLCRLGFVASELLLRRCDEREDETAIILFNHSSSIQADKNYQTSIADPENYFPSPSAFVYTLPNIVTGEIAIRHHIQGETSFYILEDEQQLAQIIESTITRCLSPILAGWCECSGPDTFNAKLQIIWNN
jgi:3-oxoacyl-[acyl-carrier-protein] synthase-1